MSQRSRVNTNICRRVKLLCSCHGDFVISGEVEGRSVFPQSGHSYNRYHRNMALSLCRMELDLVSVYVRKQQQCNKRQGFVIPEWISQTKRQSQIFFWYIFISMTQQSLVR